MNEFIKEDSIIVLPCDNRHKFHEGCIENWLGSNGICPICKKEINEQSLDESIA